MELSFSHSPHQYKEWFDRLFTMRVVIQGTWAIKICGYIPQAFVSFHS